MSNIVKAVPKAVVPKADLDKLLHLLPSEEMQRVLGMIDALDVFRRSDEKARCAAAMAERLEGLGYSGISLKSLYRKCKEVFPEDDNGYVRVNVWGAVDKRTARRISSQGLAFKEKFVRYWHEKILMSRRGKVRTAWKLLLERLAAGDEIPGYGTWKDLYLQIHGYRPAADEACPWNTLNPPPGWSLRNLAGLKPGKFEMKAAQIGMGAAKLDYLPTVRLTRVGLKPCQVVEVDDMWYEHDVIFAGNREPQRVVEFAMLDRLTGYVIAHLAKPVVEGADGKRKTLKAAWINYLYHYLFCIIGIPEGVRVVIKGEHGTAKMGDALAQALEAINVLRPEGEKIEIRAGSIITQPNAKGLPDVQHHGTPRHKSSLEGLHGPLKNIVDGLCFGNIGGGRGVQPEDTVGMVRDDSALMRIASGLPDKQLKYNFPTWERFAEIIDRAYEILNNRTDHQMEGWEECGFMVGEIGVAGLPANAMPRLASLPDRKREMLQALIASGQAEYKERRMSPAEAWHTATKANRMVKIADGFAPMIMGRELAHRCKVSDKLMLTVRDSQTGEKYNVAAVMDNRPLERGAEVFVWVNPLDAGKAYVCDLQGRYLGVAKVLQAARADADASVPELQEQLGLRSAALADAKERLEPIVRARLKERNEAAAENIATLGLDDPVERAEQQRSAEESAAAAGVADMSDLVASDSGDDSDKPIKLEDLI